MDGDLEERAGDLVREHDAVGGQHQRQDEAEGDEHEHEHAVVVRELRRQLLRQLVGGIHRPHLHDARRLVRLGHDDIAEPAGQDRRDDDDDSVNRSW